MIIVMQTMMFITLRLYPCSRISSWQPLSSDLSLQLDSWLHLVGIMMMVKVVEMVILPVIIPLLHLDALAIVTGELSIFASRQLEEMSQSFPQFSYCKHVFFIHHYFICLWSNSSIINLNICCVAHPIIALKDIASYFPLMLSQDVRELAGLRYQIS